MASLKNAITTLWETRFNEPLQQIDLGILLQKKGKDYKYIKQNPDDTISFKAIPITRLSKSYTHKNSSAKKISPNQLLANFPAYHNLPALLNLGQLIKMGLVSKNLDKGTTSFPSKLFTERAKQVYSSMKIKQTESLEQYNYRLRLIQKEFPPPRRVGRQVRRGQSYVEHLCMIPDSIHVAALLFPIRPLTCKQMQSIIDYPEEQFKTKYSTIQKHLFRGSLLDIIKERDLTFAEKTQLCHLHQIINNYLCIENTGSTFFEPERIRRIITSLQSDIQLPESFPPLTENKIKQILKTITFIIENIPNDKLTEFLMNT